MQTFDTFGNCRDASDLSTRSNLRDRETAVPLSERALFGSCGRVYWRSRPRSIANRRLSQSLTTSMRFGRDYAPNMNGCRLSGIGGTHRRGANDTDMLSRRTKADICWVFWIGSRHY